MLRAYTITFSQQRGTQTNKQARPHRRYTKSWKRQRTKSNNTDSRTSSREYREEQKAKFHNTINTHVEEVQVWEQMLLARGQADKYLGARADAIEKEVVDFAELTPQQAK